MAGSKPGRRKSTLPASAAEGGRPIERDSLGKTQSPAQGQISAESEAAVLLPSDASIRGLTRKTRRQLSIIRGSASLGAALRVRHTLREEMLKDVFETLRTLMEAAVEDPAKYGRLGYEAAKLVLDKLIGFPTVPYDEQEAMGVQVVEGASIERAAADVTKALQSAPLEQYLEIAEKGRLPDGS